MHKTSIDVIPAVAVAPAKAGAQAVNNFLLNCDFKKNVENLGPGVRRDDGGGKA